MYRLYWNCWWHWWLSFQLTSVIGCHWTVKWLIDTLMQSKLWTESPAINPFCSSGPLFLDAIASLRVTGWLGDVETVKYIKIFFNICGWRQICFQSRSVQRHLCRWRFIFCWLWQELFTLGCAIIHQDLLTMIILHNVSMFDGFCMLKLQTEDPQVWRPAGSFVTGLTGLLIRS